MPVHDSVDGDEVDVSDMLLEVGPPPLPLSPGRDQPSDWVMVDVRASFGSAGDSFAIVDGGDQYDTDDDGPLEAQRREVEGADDDVIMDVELQPSLTDIPSNVSLSGIRDDFLADHAEDPVRETAEAMAMEDDGDDGCGVDCDARHTTRSTNRSEAGSDAALRG
ncbi:hypothetical protein KEM52_004567 [Ascosphaera acerosa]|nr:hypothetical protein KEM52_004567 [Ascosphaera acerosa]